MPDLVFLLITYKVKKIYYITMITAKNLHVRK